MKNFILLIFIVFTFNACSFTSHYKVNQNLEFELLPENERKTYTIFGKEQFIQEEQSKSDYYFKEESFAEEFAQEPEELDPLESYNRLATKFNDYLFINFLSPTAKTYSNLVNEDIRVGVSNFFDNIVFPVRFANNLLQFKFQAASEELGSFLINSTVGVLGFMNPAEKYFNLKRKPEDFGQTLGYYGVKEGFHIVLPILGPSNIRDLVGISFDSYIDPLSTGDIKYKIPNRTEKAIGISAYSAMNNVSLNLGKYENIKKDAIDLYPFFKDVYNQKRRKSIKE